MAVGHHTRIATKTCPIVVILTTNAAKVIGASENGGKQAQHNNEQPLLPFLTIFRTWAKREREKARKAKMKLYLTAFLLSLATVAKAGTEHTGRVRTQLFCERQCLEVKLQ